MVPTSSNRRIVLAHGFTQTARSWETVRGTARGAPADRRRRRRRHARARHRRRRPRRPVAERRPPHRASAGRATYVGYSMGGRVALHAATRPSGQFVERLVLIGATAGIDDDDERADRRRADEAPGRSHRGDRCRGIHRRVAGHPAVRAAHAVERSTWRPPPEHRGGPGLEPPLDRHRHAGTAVGPPRRDRGPRARPRRRRRTRSSARSASASCRTIPASEFGRDRRRRPQRPSRGADRDRRRHRPMARPRSRRGASPEIEETSTWLASKAGWLDERPIDARHGRARSTPRLSSRARGRSTRRGRTRAGAARSRRAHR